MKTDSVTSKIPNVAEAIAAPLHPKTPRVESESLKLKPNESPAAVPVQNIGVSHLLVKQAKAIADFEKTIISFANSLCKRRFRDFQTAVNEAIKEIETITAIPKPEHYGISADSIKRLENFKREVLTHVNDYTNQNKEIASNGLGLASLMKLCKEIEYIKKSIPAIKKAFVKHTEQQKRVEEFITNPNPKINFDLRGEIIDARAGMKNGLGTNQLGESNRLGACLVSPSGTTKIGEVFGAHVGSGDVFINEIFRATDRQGTCTSLIDNLQKAKLERLDDEGLRQLQKKASSTHIYTKIPINTESIRKGEPLVLPTKFGYTAIATNAKYKEAKKDSFGLTYLYGLDTSSLAKDSSGQTYISYVLEMGDDLRRAPVNLENWLELPEGPQILDKYPVLKDILDKVPYEGTRYEIIKALIVNKQIYIDDPQLALAISNAPNIPDIQDELGFLGVCRDFTYSADLMLREARVPTLEASGLVVDGSRTGFDANQTHAINLTILDEKIVEKDFTQANGRVKVPDDLLREISMKIREAGRIANGNADDFRHICRTKGYFRELKALLAPYRATQNSYRPRYYYRYQLPSAIAPFFGYLKTGKTRDHKELETNLRASNNPSLAHAVIESMRDHSPLTQLLKDPTKVEMIEHLWEYSLRENLFDLSLDQIRIIAPAFRNIGQGIVESNLATMYNSLLEKKIYTETEIKTLKSKVMTCVALINEITERNFNLDMDCPMGNYDIPGFNILINVSRNYPDSQEWDPEDAKNLLESMKEIIFFDANGKIDPLSAPNLFLEKFPFANDSAASKSPQLEALLDKQVRTKLKRYYLTQDLSMSPKIELDKQHALAFAALDLSKSKHPLAEAFRLLATLTPVQNNEYYQGAKVIFRKYPSIHKRYLDAFNNNDLVNKTRGWLILGAIDKAYGYAQANLWGSVTCHFDSDSMIKLLVQPYLTTNRKKELLERLPEEDTDAKELIANLHEDLVFLLTEYARSPDYRAMTNDVFEERLGGSQTFIELNEEVESKLNLGSSVFDKQELELGPASPNFPELRDLVNNFNKAPYLITNNQPRNDNDEYLQTGINPNPYSFEIRNYAPGDPRNAIAKAASARYDRPLVRASNTLMNQANLHHYVVDLRFLENPESMQSLLREIEEKLNHKDHRNIRGNTKLELKLTLSLDGTRITEFNHQALQDAFNRSSKNSRPGYGSRTNLEGFVAELQLLAKRRPALIPDQFIKGSAFEGFSKRRFLAEHSKEMKSKNYSCFVVSDDTRFVDSLQQTIYQASPAKAIWLRVNMNKL